MFNPFVTDKFTVTAQEAAHGSLAVIRHPGAVVILPFVDDQRICLIVNHRRAVNEKLIELPAGTREPGEPARLTACRELAEETGYRATTMEPLFEYLVSPGIMDEKMDAFVARGLVPGQQSLMEDEEIETLVVEMGQALEWIREGKIRDAKTLATLLFFRQFG